MDKKDKPSMKELLAKKKKNKGKKQDTTSAPKEDEEPVNKLANASQEYTQDAESPDLPKQGKPVDEDESDDETNYTAKTNLKVVEHQADSSKKQDVIEVPDYMRQKDEKEADTDDKKPIKRRNANDIQFGGGRPQFGNRKVARGILGGDDFESLDALNDDGVQKKSKKNTSYNANQSDFVNLGSTPVQRNAKKFEEEKEKEKPKGPPKFFNANKGKNAASNQTQSTGQNIMYDFGVKYKSENTDGKKFQDKDNNEDCQMTEVRKDKRRINQDKARFDDKNQGLDNEDMEEGFEIVRNPQQKRNQRRQLFNRDRAKDLDDERRNDEGQRSGQQAAPAQPLKRGGAFGNIGGDSD